MSSLLKLFSLLAAARSSCPIQENRNIENSPKKAATLTVCPELCLTEPGCNNEILDKFNIGLFILDVKPREENEEEKSEIREDLLPLKIFKFNERRDSCCTSNSVVVSFIKPVCKITQEFAFLILAPKTSKNSRLPHVFATNFSRSVGIEQKVALDEHRVIYRIPIKDIESLLVTITDLGIANSGHFAKNASDLDITLESDIFTNGPLVVSLPFDESYCVPTSFKVPDNTMLKLAAIQKDLKASLVCPTVPKQDINKMAVAAFINEIRYLFTCPKKVEKYEQNVCEKIVADYCVFVSSCVKVIAHCEEKREVNCIFNVPAHCNEENKFACLYNNICGYANNCKIGNAKINVEIGALFAEVAPLAQFNKEVECLKFVELEESSSSSSSSSEESEELKKKKALAMKKKPVAKVKTTTTVSTYGWYVAGGVVVVSVAVAVYVFAL